MSFPVAVEWHWPWPVFAGWPTELIDYSEAMAWAAFFMILAAVALTLILQLLLQPETRQEKAELCKIIAFNIIMWRTIITLVTGYPIPLPIATVLWVIVYYLVGFYFVTLVDQWCVKPLERFCRIGLSGRRWIVTLTIMLIVLSVIFTRVIHFEVG